MVACPGICLVFCTYQSQVGGILWIELTHELVEQGVTFTESQYSIVPDMSMKAAEWFDSQSIMVYPTCAMLNHPDFWETVKNHFDIESPDYNYLPSEVDLRGYPFPPTR